MKKEEINRIEIFQILGIEETKDERRIKNAYREKLAMTNPEDDPEGFKRLRSAYDTACRLAKESDDEQEEQPRDTTPSGLWMEKAVDIYHNIHTRQDLKRWEELFMDDCFLSLEDEENCRFKLLSFLTEHFRLSTDVWKLLDKKLSISSDGMKLKEQFPADFVRYILNRCEHGEDVEFSQFEGPEDGDYDLFLQYYDRAWQALAESKTEEAAQYIENGDRLGISHPIMEICRGNLLEQQGKAAEALALMEKLRERYPQDAMVGYNTAEMLWKQGRKENGYFREKAVKIYQELKEQNASHYMVNVRLTEWYYEQGQYKKAKSCAEKVLSSGSDENFMKLLGKINAEIEGELEEEYRRTKKWEPALELCWCYLQDGKIAKGINLAVSLEKQLPPEKEAEFNGLMAKLYVEEAEYEDSITMTYAWEESLHKRLESEESGEEKEKDRDRLKQAHLIRMQCYHNLGFRDREQFGKAVEESKKLLTNSVKDIGILLEQAQLYMEMEEYEQCQELVDRLVDEYQVYAAYAIALEAYRKQYDAGGVVRSGSQCIRYFPNFLKAYEYLAELYLNLNYREELEKLLEEADKNKTNSDILNAYRYQRTHRIMELSVLNDKLRNFREKYLYCIRDHLKDTKLYEDGLKIITEYLYHYPDSFLFVERGEYHREAHHYEEARKDYEKALSLDPANSRGLRGLSQVYRAKGNYEKALIYMKRAILYMDENMSLDIYQEMGELYSLLGDNRRALSVHMEYVRMRGASPGFSSLNALMEARLRMGQLEEAERISGQMNEPDSFLDYAYRGTLCRRGGDERKARELQETWRRKLASWRRTPGMGRADLIGRGARSLDRRIRGDAKSRALYGNFFDYSAWVELIFGDPGEAVRYFRECIVCRTPPLCRSIVEHEKADIVFACILCGDDTQGKKYSERLRKRMKEAEKAKPKDGDDFFCNEYKRGLYCRILSCFYTAPLQEIQGILDQEKGMTSCDLCTRPFCSELEVIRIMLLYRQGKQQEARERLERNLEILPQDEYMRAIKHSVFDRNHKT